MRKSRSLWILALALALLLPARALASSAPETELYALLCEDRAKYGKPTLALDPALCALARRKAEDMRDNNYCAHLSPSLGSARQMLTNAGVSFKGVGENIARCRDVEHAHAAFLSSWGHRINELSASYTHVGVGVAVTKSGFVYVCELFVRR